MEVRSEIRESGGVKMQKDMFKSEMQKGADISSCGKYRYSLWRIWSSDKPHALFIMLNPSTADASEDDATIRRCIGFTREWGYGGLYVANLFALRSTDPAALRHFIDPVGLKNDQYIKELAQGAGVIVLAWGNHGEYKRRADEVLNILYRLKAVRLKVHHFGLTNQFQPKHPLYLPKDAGLIKAAG